MLILSAFFAMVCWNQKFISIFVYQYRPSFAAVLSPAGYSYPDIEAYYYPGYFTSTMTTFVNNTDTEIASTYDTPDYRVEEKMLVLYNEARSVELNRPMRNSPPYKQSQKGSYSYWRASELEMGCYCCITYRRVNLVAGCAVITSRHVLTTANPTVLLLRSYGHLTNLENIVGGWYDTNANYFNASLYFSPSRIHIHPLYVQDYDVNVTHPIPVIYDLALWASTYTFYGGAMYQTKVLLCPRAASGWHEYTSSIPRENDISTVIGYHFMKAYKRRPLPWMRYLVKTKDHVWPCPKTEWQWYHCVMGEYWGRYGFDSGGGMHGCYQNTGWRYDGIAGLCSFSLKLRAQQTVHYFTVIDCYPVLDFLYDGILGKAKNVWLDFRFEDTKYAAPIPYYGEYIDILYEWGQEIYYESAYLPKYRR